MSTLTLAPTITRSAGLPSPKGSTLLRKCACGGNKQSDDEKKRKSALLQRKGQRPSQQRRKKAYRLLSTRPCAAAARHFPRPCAAILKRALAMISAG